MDGDEQGYKLTMVSMYANGRAFTRFIELPIGENGKPYIPPATFRRYCRELNVGRGTTFSMDLP